MEDSTSSKLIRLKHRSNLKNCKGLYTVPCTHYVMSFALCNVTLYLFKFCMCIWRMHDVCKHCLYTDHTLMFIYHLRIEGPCTLHISVDTPSRRAPTCAETLKAKRCRQDGLYFAVLLCFRLRAGRADQPEVSWEAKVRSFGGKHVPCCCVHSQTSGVGRPFCS